ncbi:unnamed protein product [Tilletia controversa]|nr:unnamed protein product [Tilletia controversa]
MLPNHPLRPITTAPDPEPEPDADSARSTPTLAFPPSPDLSSPRGGGLAASLSVPQRPGQNRGRSSSLLKLEHIQDSHDVMLDQNAGFNANADWVNHKGAWVVHIVLILAGKILLDVVLGITQDVSWTLVTWTTKHMEMVFKLVKHVSLLFSF